MKRVIVLLLLSGTVGLALAQSAGNVFIWRHNQHGYTSGTSETRVVSGTSVTFTRNPGEQDNKLNRSIITQPPTRIISYSKHDPKVGLQLWLDAYRLRLSPADPKISQWISEVIPRGASQALSATPVNLDARPTLEPNQIASNAVMRFDGVDDHLRVPDLADTGEFSVYVVGRLRQSPGGRGILTLAPASGQPYWQLATNPTGNAIVARIAGQEVTAAAGDLSNKSWLAVLSHKNGAGSTFYLKNTSATIVSTSQARTNATLFIGALKDGGHAPLDLGEVRIYDRRLSAEEHVELTRALLKKWGLD